MTKLSIIIPIYNTPTEDLRRCFDSIAPPDTWEVLLIDDGSQEAVGVFCREYCKLHPGFRYFYQENGGVSSARNLGIAQARGQYLTFIDADDCLLPQAISQGLEQYDSDLIFFDMQLTQQGKDSLWSAFPHPEGKLSREQVLYQLCTSASISGPAAKLYKTEKLNGIRFDPAFITGEDWMFVCDFTLRSESFAYLKTCTYRYFRSGATSQGRLLRFPDTMLRNLTDRYERKLEIIASTPWTRYTQAQIHSPAAAELIENLFNAAATLRMGKALTKERKAFIRKNAIKASEHLTQGHKKTRIKLWVLRSCPVILYPIALLRKLYLKFKY